MPWTPFVYAQKFVLCFLPTEVRSHVTKGVPKMQHSVTIRIHYCQKGALGIARLALITDIRDTFATIRFTPTWSSTSKVPAMRQPLQAPLLNLVVAVVTDARCFPLLTAPSLATKESQTMPLVVSRPIRYLPEAPLGSAQHVPRRAIQPICATTRSTRTWSCGEPRVRPNPLLPLVPAMVVTIDVR